MRAVVIIAALALAALAPASSDAQGTPGKGSLKDAIGRCTAVKSMLDRLKCFDQLARDVRDFDEVVAEACACKGGPADATAGLSQPSLPATGAGVKTGTALRPVLPSKQQNKAGADSADPGKGSTKQSVAIRESYGTGKWKQIPRYRDDGLMVAVKIELISESEIRNQSQKVARPVLTINCADIGMSVWMETSFTSAGDDTPVTMQFDDDEPYILRWANTTDGKFMGIWNFGEELTKKAMNYDKMKITFKPDASTTTSTSFDIRGLTTASKPLRQLCTW